MQGSRRVRANFMPEWLGIAILAVLDAVWALRIDFHLILAWRDAMVLALTLALMLALQGSGRDGLWKRGGVIAEYFALTLAATNAFAVLSYLSLASSGPLVDSNLVAADRMLGFDWLASYHYLLSHAMPRMILHLAYGTLVYQGLYFCVLMGVMDRRREMREMFWLVFIAGLLTSAGVLLFPALGPFKIFAAGPADSFVPEMERIRNGHSLVIALSKMTGVVSFPSFHTTMALAYSWGFRRTGPIGWLIAAINLLMLISIPYFGGHYLVDMIAGAAVMLVSLGLVKLYATRRTSAASASPEYVAESAGAY